MNKLKLLEVLEFWEGVHLENVFSADAVFYKYLKKI